MQPSSEGFPGGLTNLNEAVAVPLIYTRTDIRLKMEAILKATISSLLQGDEVELRNSFNPK